MRAEELRAACRPADARESVFMSLCIAALFRARLREPLNVPVSKGDGYALRYGPHTRDVANCNGQSLQYVRRHLLRLVGNGRVLWHRYPGGMSAWWPDGFAEALEASKVVEDGITYYEFPPGFVQTIDKAGGSR